MGTLASRNTPGEPPPGKESKDSDAGVFDQCNHLEAVGEEKRATDEHGSNTDQDKKATPCSDPV
jgi:hypothetical protein